MDFSSTIKTQMAGRIVRAAFLVEFRFVTGAPVRLWRGFGPLKTLDDREWRGAGEAGEISGLGQSINGGAPAFNLTLSGVEPTFYALAQGERSEW